MTPSQYEWSKRGLVIIGGLIALAGTVAVDGTIRRIDDRIAAAETSAAMYQRIGSRARDYHATFLSVLRSAEDELTRVGQAPHLDIEAANTALGDAGAADNALEVIACEAADRRDRDTDLIEEVCSSQYLKLYGKSSVAQPSRAMLKAAGVALMKDSIKFDRRYQNTRTALEGSERDARQAAVSLRNEKGTWQSRQSLVTVLGIIIALTKDLVPKPDRRKPSRAYFAFVRGQHASRSPAASKRAPDGPRAGDTN